MFTRTLTAADLRRLEHACGEALSREELLLELDVRALTEFDRPALALVERPRPGTSMPGDRRPRRPDTTLSSERGRTLRSVRDTAS